MFKKFKSIANSAKYGYSFDTNKWEYRVNPFLTQKFRMFETFGDGLTQHSHDWPVTEDFAIDYLYSLAEVVVNAVPVQGEGESDYDFVDRVSYTCNSTVRPELLRFAASLVFNPEKDKEWNKHRYFSISEMKVTRNQDKQHDTRYRELNEYHDGTPGAIFGLVVGEHDDGYERWQKADAVRNWVADNLKNSFMEMPAVQLKWFEGKQHDQYQKARDFRDAHEALQFACAIWRSKRNAVNYLECYRRNLANAAQRESATQTAEETPAEPDATVAA